jgi:adenylyl-sulfate kinase
MTTIWLTGFSGAGKTTIGNSLVENLKKYEKVIMLDGDELRKGLNSDLGFSMEDRAENIRRVAHTAKLLSDSGLLVITTLISPTKNSREQARKIIGENFIECYIKSDIEICIKRDVKGLYKKAISGEIKEFTGISSIYEIPQKPELILDTQNLTIGECTNIAIDFLVEKKLIKITNNEGWLKINHGGQKLNLTPNQKAIFIGRWQPFHKSHEELIWNKLKDNIPVLIMVRDIPNDEKNPFTTSQVVDMVKKVYEDKKELVEVVIIPDIESVNFGRGVGYEINEFIPNKSIEDISATKIRKSLNEKSEIWTEMVPEKVVESLKKYLEKGAQ